MKTVKQYFPVVLFIMPYKVVLALESVMCRRLMKTFCREIYLQYNFRILFEVVEQCSVKSQFV